MYAFTDCGIWGLKVSDTGGFQSLQATSRDVLTRGTTPLQLGQSIVFLADRSVFKHDFHLAIQHATYHVFYFATYSHNRCLVSRTSHNSVTHTLLSLSLFHPFVNYSP